MVANKLSSRGPDHQRVVSEESGNVQKDHSRVETSQSDDECTTVKSGEMTDDSTPPNSPKVPEVPKVPASRFRVTFRDSPCLMVFPGDNLCYGRTISDLSTPVTRTFEEREDSDGGEDSDSEVSSVTEYLDNEPASAHAESVPSRVSCGLKSAFLSLLEGFDESCGCRKNICFRSTEKVAESDSSVASHSSWGTPRIIDNDEEDSLHCGSTFGSERVSTFGTTIASDESHDTNPSLSLASVGHKGLDDGSNWSDGDMELTMDRSILSDVSCDTTNASLYSGHPDDDQSTSSDETSELDADHTVYSEEAPPVDLNQPVTPTSKIEEQKDTGEADTNVKQSSQGSQGSKKEKQEKTDDVDKNAKPAIQGSHDSHSKEESRKKADDADGKAKQAAQGSKEEEQKKASNVQPTNGCHGSKEEAQEEAEEVEQGIEWSQIFTLAKQEKTEEDDGNVKQGIEGPQESKEEEQETAEVVDRTCEEEESEQEKRDETVEVFKGNEQTAVQIFKGNEQKAVQVNKGNEQKAVQVNKGRKATKKRFPFKLFSRGGRGKKVPTTEPVIDSNHTKTTSAGTDRLSTSKRSISSMESGIEKVLDEKELNLDLADSDRGQHPDGLTETPPAESDGDSKRRLLAIADGVSKSARSLFGIEPGTEQVFDETTLDRPASRTGGGQILGSSRKPRSEPAGGNANACPVIDQGIEQVLDEAEMKRKVAKIGRLWGKLTKSSGKRKSVREKEKRKESTIQSQTPNLSESDAKGSPTEKSEERLESTTRPGSPNLSGEVASGTQSSVDLQPNPFWKAAKASNGRTYYYHRLTRRTTWTVPDDSVFSTCDSGYAPETSCSFLPSSCYDESPLPLNQLWMD